MNGNFFSRVKERAAYIYIGKLNIRVFFLFEFFLLLILLKRLFLCSCTYSYICSCLFESFHVVYYFFRFFGLFLFYMVLLFFFIFFRLFLIYTKKKYTCYLSNKTKSPAHIRSKNKVKNTKKIYLIFFVFCFALFLFNYL